MLNDVKATLFSSASEILCVNFHTLQKADTWRQLRHTHMYTDINIDVFRDKQYQLDTHFTFHFIEVHSLDMFRAIFAHPQEALHKRRVGDCCVRL
jgi:hypothetical protein